MEMPFSGLFCLLDGFASACSRNFILTMHLFPVCCQSTSKSHTASSLEKQIGESFYGCVLSL